MMRDAIGWVAAAAFALGCAVEDGPPAVEEIEAAPGVTANLGFEPFPPPAELCSWRRTIVYQQTGGCAAAAGWTAAKVFGGNEVELRRYCRYTFNGPGEPTAADLGALFPNSPRSPDCLVVTPAGEEAWVAARESFAVQIDAPALALPPPPAPPPSTTWVAVVDTSPRSPLHDGEAWPGTNPHGYVLGRIVREVGCADGPGGGSPCVVRVHHELALPHALDGGMWSADPEGGHYGYQSDLAAAIDRSVDAWRQGGEPSGAHLVVNLSLGWIGAFGGGAGDMSADLVPARAVHAAIQKAVCRGGLVFAATGNDSGGTMYTTGPLYPAAWTLQDRPTVSRCKAFGDAVAGYSAVGRLVEAVGGVDGADRELAIARPLSTPRLVAPGSFGAAFGTDGQPLAPLTGTSVATAVASAAAAVAWAYVPTFSPQSVAESVYLSGPALGGVAHPSACRGVCSIRRVSTCGALARACSDGAGGLRWGCAPTACLGRPAFADARPDLRAGMFDPPTEVRSAASLVPMAGGAPAACGATTAVYRPGGSSGAGEVPCPERQFYGGAAHPSVEPQPSGAGCTVCNHRSFAGSLTIDVELDEDAEGPLSFPSLLVTTSAGRFRYALWELPDGPSSLRVGPVYRITDIPAPGGVVRSVLLTAVNAGGDAWEAELVRVTGD